MKRCVWPSDPELAVRGGFLVCTTPAGHPIYRNPAAPHVIPLFPGLLALCQVLHGLTSPQALALLSEVSTPIEDRRRFREKVSCSEQMWIQGEAIAVWIDFGVNSNLYEVIQ